MLWRVDGLSGFKELDLVVKVRDRVGCGCKWFLEGMRGELEIGEELVLRGNEIVKGGDLLRKLVNEGGIKVVG